ncbi:ATP-binding protein [Nocardioides sp. YIM 152315]|uniref:PAS domain-containing sensor histidine kinase n=1 Tax=Nocardioides sp. YIM 152315 TaxID=3031760 RepID=UPI0023DA1CAE|nr:ATP-binding protein [Nocardioides sp. YIM 152315]MDF1603420.1 ATP-binding protein [Nocardioides sp. YIM 152315]
MRIPRLPAQVRGQWGSTADTAMAVAATACLAATTYSVLRYRQARRAASTHRAVDRALAETTERYRTLFEYHPDGVFSLSLDGRFTSANEVSARLSGYTEDELCRMSFTDLLPDDQVEAVGRSWDDVVARRPRHLEATIRHKDGHRVDLSLTGLPIVVDDEIVGVYGIAEDITRRNRMQREVEQARADAEEANRAKSLFLATMSHEVRTPLTSVIAASEMLDDTELDDVQRRLTDTLHRSGVRLLRLVDDILDFSRIEAGRTQLEAVPFDVAALLEEALAPSRRAAAERGLAFETAYAELPARLVGDPVRIAQVVTNLLDNAVKFTEAGSVRLVARAKDADRGLDLHLEVADTGIGMTPEQVRTVFEPFRQADSSITRRYGGTGLGLAICRQLIEQMDGTFDVDSTPGSGTTFTVRLPLGLAD